MADETTAVAPAPSYESRMVKFKETWERAMPTIKSLLPSHVTAERLFSVAVTARMRNPKLMECTDVSVLRGIIIGAQLGLDVSGVGGKAYLVPYWNGKTKQLEAQFQAGYRGLMELARRSGQIAAFYGKVIHEKDDFAYEDGLVQRLHHVPYMGAEDPGQVLGCWVVAVWANGFRQMQVLSKLQLEKIRKSSKAADDGPWVNWYEEMALKSTLKRMLKLLPDSVELNRVLAMEDGADAGTPYVDVELPEVETPALPPPTRTEAIKEGIRKIAEKEDAAMQALPVKRGPGRPPKPKPVEATEGIPNAPAMVTALATEPEEELPAPEVDEDY